MNVLNLSRLPLAILVASIVSACSLAPKYEQPHAPIPDDWPAEATTNDGRESDARSVEEFSWHDFVINDEARELVQLALKNNHDLRKALLNIEAARAQYRITRADRLPGIEAQGQGSRQRVPSDLSVSGQGGVQSSYQVGLGLSAFELDLFGRVRNLSESALREYLATEEAARAVRISLIGEVLEAYITADGALRRRELTEETLLTRQVSLELIKSRHAAGVASSLDYQDALGLTEDAKAEFERTDREYNQARNALTLLVGTGLDRNSMLSTLPEGSVVSDVIAPGLPADLLTRRPDIRAAEQRLIARNADIGAARAAFFPSISLTGTFGTSSAELSGLFDSGSRAWVFIPQINLPLFRGGANVAGLDLATVRKDVAIADYEQTVQQAFREVADALDGKETLTREAQARSNLAESSTTALRLAEARYRQGVDGYLRYLDSQRSSFVDRLDVIDVMTQHQISIVRLFKALGGGWQDQPPPPPSA